MINRSRSCSIVQHNDPVFTVLPSLFFDGLYTPHGSLRPGLKDRKVVKIF
jgi:hypothetical protein